MKAGRIEEIKAFILENETVSLDELVERFGVTKYTIRRDVQELVDGGDFNKVYGGVSVNSSTSVTFNDRKSRSLTEKQGIAKFAANLVEENDIIFIDSGTTTLGMLEHLKDIQLTVVTNNIDFVIDALPYENLNVFSIGGMLERKTKSLTSIESKNAIKGYNITKAFLASTGVSIKNGVTNSFPIETELKASVVEKSEEIFLLVDHNKFDKYSLTTYCELKEIDYIVTDKTPSKKYIQFAKENDISLVVTEREKIKQ
ncbi:DeoR/GlpR family DNA-binding transcription regulator [Aquibacillus sediminis]|uniref:DeoR/GlpR family DNA-binding transcription regulator n=1 Tax=Aquibacillus sediminis TaxID=2574734 RepID=UPI0011091CBD|nr:DeoR/GlpR family DNA-binding transcription regulator [Aquibacillus sediminis]